MVFKRTKAKIKQKLRENRGFSLVELLVCFTLLAILMTAVASCIPSVMKSYYNIQKRNHEKTICYTLSNRIKSELQTMCGVEDSVDGYSGVGYFRLTQDDVAVPYVDGATLTGNGVEFLYEDGLMERMDTKGYDGYLVRKKIVKSDYSGAKKIQPGNLMFRYHEFDTEMNQYRTDMIYNSSEYGVESGISISDGAAANVVFALEAPYGEQFYMGYDVDVQFELPATAFTGPITSVDVTRNYVKYVNYTISLFENGTKSYSQRFCANIENVVPYEGVTSVPPVPPVVPEMPSGSFVRTETSWKDVGYAIEYDYTFKVYNDTDNDISDWKCVIDFGNYTSWSSNTYYQGQEYWRIEVDQSQPGKLIFMGDHLNPGDEPYIFKVHIVVNHDWNEVIPEEEMKNEQYPVTMYCTRNYVQEEDFDKASFLYNESVESHNVEFYNTSTVNKAVSFYVDYPYYVDISTFEIQWPTAPDMKYELIEQDSNHTRIWVHGQNLVAGVGNQYKLGLKAPEGKEHPDLVDDVKLIFFDNDEQIKIRN